MVTHTQWCVCWWAHILTEHRFSATLPHCLTAMGSLNKGFHPQDTMWCARIQEDEIAVSVVVSVSFFPVDAGCWGVSGFDTVTSSGLDFQLSSALRSLTGGFPGPFPVWIQSKQTRCSLNVSAGNWTGVAFPMFIDIEYNDQIRLWDGKVTPLWKICFSSLHPTTKE